MWRFPISVLAVLGGIFLISKEKKLFGAEPYDSITGYSDNELITKFTLQQLEVAYMESVSLDNKNAQRRLKRAIARKKFIDEWQTEGV